MLRNPAAIAIAGALSMPYTPHSTYVDLFIDGGYYGLYLLSEKVQIGKNRIGIESLEDSNEKENEGTDLSKIEPVSGETYGRTNLSYIRYVPLPKQPDDISGGYLIEIDNLYSNADSSVFVTGNGNHYVVKSPEAASYDETMYIAGLVSEMGEALYSKSGYNSFGCHYSEYIDVDSLAKNYIVREVMKDWDAFNGSTFFYKDADKNGVVSELYLGPVWDFDLTLDNNTTEEYYLDSLLWGQGENDILGSRRLFGKYIMIHPEMKVLVAKYYCVASQTVDEICSQGGYLDKLKDVILNSDLMERIRWSDFIEYSRVFSDGIDNGESSYAGTVKGRLSARAKDIAPYIGDYTPDEGYYSVTLSPALVGKVKLCCETVYFGNRAAVRILTDSKINLVAESADGKKYSLRNQQRVHSTRTAFTVLKCLVRML